MITIGDIARRTGLSQPTVSSVMNGLWQERRICAQTRDRVLATAKQMNYQPNRLARGLTSGKTGTIGLIIRTVDHPTHSAFSERLLHLIKKSGFEALVGVVPDLSNTRAIEELYYAHRPEALVVGPLFDLRVTPFFRKLLQQGFPLVAFLGYRPFPGDLVTYDIAAAVRLSIEHLRARGHVRIGGVGWGHLAREAFLAASGMAPRHWHKLWGSFKNGYNFARTLELSPDGPTAYLFEDPLFVMGFERGALQRGLRIPADVAFVVNGQCQAGNFCPWSFTTVGPNQDEMAKRICELVIDRIRGEAPRASQTVTLESRLVCGESSGGAGGSGQRSAVSGQQSAGRNGGSQQASRRPDLGRAGREEQTNETTSDQ